MFDFLCDAVIRPEWVTKSFPYIKFILLCLIVIAAILLVVMVLMQETDNESGANAITGIKESYYSKNKGMNKEEHNLMQTMVERGYDLFTSRCAEGRHVEQDYIKSIGEGRVWLGNKGVEIGIVDELGNIDDAIAKAVELAGLESYKLTYYPEKQDPFEELLKMLDNSTEEERLIMKVRDFCSKPRIMALMPEVKIQ